LNTKVSYKKTELPAYTSPSFFSGNISKKSFGFLDKPAQKSFDFLGYLKKVH